jgi:YD repeat-containing protein
MSTITIERAKLEQALEALVIADNIALVGAAYTPKSIDAGVLKMRNAMIALREAMAEQPAQQEPVPLTDEQIQLTGGSMIDFKIDLNFDPMTIPLGYTYDKAGSILTHRDKDGFWLVYTYTHDDRILSYRDKTGLWYVYTYTYDVAGKCTIIKCTITTKKCTEASHKHNHN